MSEIRFNVRRDGCDVIVSVVPFANVNVHLPFKWTCTSELEAEAYYRLILDGSRQRVLAIRRDAYNRGFVEGRSRRKRREPMFDCINSENEP